MLQQIIIPINDILFFSIILFSHIFLRPYFVAFVTHLLPKLFLIICNSANKAYASSYPI